MKSIFLLFFAVSALQGMAQKSPYRRVLIFAPDSTNSAFKEQNSALKRESASCIERDIVIENYVYQLENAAVFKQYQVKKGLFTVLLVGKDGFVKLRSDTALSAQRLFSIIDFMPMRRDEVKQRKKSSF